MRGEVGRGILHDITPKIQRFQKLVLPYLGYAKGEQNEESKHHFGDEFAPTRNLSKLLLDKGFSPTEVTVMGAFSRSLGSGMLTKPKFFQEAIHKTTGHKPKMLNVVLAGCSAYGIGLLCDVLDGEMASQSEASGIGPGETIKGRIADGWGDKTAELTGALLTQLFPEHPNEKMGWSYLADFSILRSTVRASAEGEGLNIGKVGSGSQLAVEGITLASHLVELTQKERARGYLGAILTYAGGVDALKRYTLILESGDKEAILRVSRDIVEFAGLRHIGKKISDNPLVPFFLEMLKFGDVMYGEVNSGVRPTDMIVHKAKKKVVEVFNNAKNRVIPLFDIRDVAA